jgi:hypothetical protein
VGSPYCSIYLLFTHRHLGIITTSNHQTSYYQEANLNFPILGLHHLCPLLRRYSQILPCLARYLTVRTSTFKYWLLQASVYRQLTLPQGPPSPNIYTLHPTLDGLQKFDIWSIGCVLSEAATWVVLGKPGIDEFQNLRRRRPLHESEMMSTGALSGDSFHDGINVLACVTSWHKYLKNAARKSDKLTAKILDIVDEDLLIGDSEKRIDVETLLVKLRLVFEQDESGE